MPYFRYTMKADGFGDNLDNMSNMRLLLDSWLQSYADKTQMTHQYTHVRCTFQVNSATLVHISTWQLLRADADSVTSYCEVSSEFLKGAAMRDFITRFIQIHQLHTVGADHGQFTITFDPPRFGWDVLASDNTPLFAEYVIDLEVEAKAQDALLKLIN